MLIEWIACFGYLFVSNQTFDETIIFTAQYYFEWCIHWWVNE